MLFRDRVLVAYTLRTEDKHPIISINESMTIHGLAGSSFDFTVFIVMV
jgi:hypothetical protein